MPYYRTTYKLVVLSEDRLSSNLTLTDLEYEITEGDCSGALEVVSEEILTAPEMAKALTEQNSDPGFFGITEEEDRCEHGQFFSGAGACPQCGR